VARVRVLLFGPLADLAATPDVSLEVRGGASVADVLALVRGRYPALGARLDSTAVAVNLSYAARDAVVRDGDEVALIPPVSGG
jgi:molybdopterin converting factor subunit 1